MTRRQWSPDFWRKLDNFHQIQVFTHPRRISQNFPQFEPACLQIDLSRSLGGVGWPDGDHVTVISDRTFDLAGLDDRRKPLNTISRPCVSFFVFLKQISIWPNDLLWALVASCDAKETHIDLMSSKSYHVQKKIWEFNTNPIYVLMKGLLMDSM